MDVDLRRQWDGPLAVWAGEVEGWLVRTGVSPGRSLRTLNALGRFSGWMAVRGLDVSALCEDLVDEYIRDERERSGCRFPAAWQYLPLAKRFFAAHGVMSLRGPASRELGGIPRLDAGPLAGVVVELVGWLREQGYARGTAHSVACTAARLGAWMHRSGHGVADLDADLLERFVMAETSGPLTHPSSARRIVTIRRFLTATGRLPAAVATQPAVVGPAAEALAGLQGWLGAQRGDGPGWIRETSGWVGPFLDQMAGPDGQVRWAEIDAETVNAYVTARGRGYSLSSRRHLVSAMRMLARWALVTGRLGTDIRAAILTGRRPVSDVPRGLTTDQVARILAAADRRRAKGLRDYAIVVLLWRLGLRAGEVAGLELDDIDWHASRLTVRGKGGRVLTLPLPVDVGEALVAHLRARHRAAGRAVFVGSRTPFTALTGKGVSSVVAALAHRAGLGTVHAHRLRHTAATGVLAGGGSVVEARELLGHARTDTTMAYARADLGALRALSLEWGRIG